MADPQHLPHTRPGRWLTLAALLLALLAAAGAILELLANTWWRQLQARLTAGSTVVDTTAGPVEYAATRAGGDRVLLVFHGTPGGCDQAIAVTAPLDLPGVRVIAPSRPGFLGTPLTTGPTLVAQADAAAALLAELGIARAAVLGLSGGGPAAVYFARRHPQLTTRLVLWEAVTRRMDLDVRHLREGLLFARMGGWALPRLLRWTARLLQPPTILRHPRALQHILILAQTTLPRAARLPGIEHDARLFDAMAPLPLHEISAPVLLVHGTADEAVPYAQSQAAAHALPHATLVTIPGANHVSALVAPQALEAIAAFLARDDQKGRLHKETGPSASVDS